MAAACNKIFISSDCPSGPVDFIEPKEKAGYLFKTNNLKSLISAIFIFLKDNKDSILNKKINAKKKSNYYTFFRFFLNFKKIFYNSIQ
jgi:glycosyltransferase involved in cell wall biosynthesis